MTKTTKQSRVGAGDMRGGGSDFLPPPSISYLEATATVYQEWKVSSKAGPSGKRVDQVMGIDAHKVYLTTRKILQTESSNAHYYHNPFREGGTHLNSRYVNQNQIKRGQIVSRSQRYVAYIIKIGFVDGDPSSFKITWGDLRDAYDTEYTCDTARDCIEIVAKIRHLQSIGSKA